MVIKYVKQKSFSSFRKWQGDLSNLVSGGVDKIVLSTGQLVTMFLLLGFFMLVVIFLLVAECLFKIAKDNSPSFLKSGIFKRRMEGLQWQKYWAQRSD